MVAEPEWRSRAAIAPLTQVLQTLILSSSPQFEDHLHHLRLALSTSSLKPMDLALMTNESDFVVIKSVSKVLMSSLRLRSLVLMTLESGSAVNTNVSLLHHPIDVV